MWADAAAIRAVSERINNPLVTHGPRADGSVIYVAWTPPATWEVWADGYKIAGDKILESIDSEFRADFAVYPMVYLYRHAVELKLKSICLSANRFSEMSYEKRIEDIATHDLNTLWNTAVELAKMADIELGVGKLISAFVDRLAELEKLTPTGEESRYPTNRKGVPNWKDVEYLDLKQFKDTMGGIWNLLDNIDTEIDHRADIVSDSYL